MNAQNPPNSLVHTWIMTILVKSLLIPSAARCRQRVFYTSMRAVQVVYTFWIYNFCILTFLSMTGFWEIVKNYCFISLNNIYAHHFILAFDFNVRNIQIYHCLCFAIRLAFVFVVSLISTIWIKHLEMWWLLCVFRRSSTVFIPVNYIFCSVLILYEFSIRSLMHIMKTRKKKKY